MQGLRDEALLRVVCERLGTTPHELSSSAVRYILHFAQLTDNADEVVRRLHRRREFERSLSLLTITPASVLCLRSGAFALWPSGDAFSRPILFVRPALIPTICRANFSLTTSSSVSSASSSSVMAGKNELEVLALLLLEYLQYVAAKSHRAASTSAASASTTATGNPLSSSSSSSSSSSPAAATSAGASGRDSTSGMDCVVLVDTTEPDSGWIRGDHSSSSSNASTKNNKKQSGAHQTVFVEEQQQQQEQGKEQGKQQQQQQQEQQGKDGEHKNTSSSSSSGLHGFSNTLASLTSKFYPGLVSACWIVLPPVSQKNFVKKQQQQQQQQSTKKSSSSAAIDRKLIPQGFERIIRFVTLRELPSLVDANSLPKRLGGRASDLPQVASSVLSSDILRCWFSLTTLLLQEQQQHNQQQVLLQQLQQQQQQQKSQNAATAAASGTITNNNNNNLTGTSTNNNSNAARDAKTLLLLQKQMPQERPVWVPLCQKLIQLERNELSSSSSAAAAAAATPFLNQGKRRSNNNENSLISNPKRPNALSAAAAAAGGGAGDLEDDCFSSTHNSSVGGVEDQQQLLLDDDEDGRCSEITTSGAEGGGGGGVEVVQDDDENGGSKNNKMTKNAQKQKRVKASEGEEGEGEDGLEDATTTEQQDDGEGNENNFRVISTEDAAAIAKLSQQLDLEKRCRAQLEAQVQRLTLGVAFEGDRSASALFGTLRACHEEANVLVAGVIQDSLQSSARTSSNANPSLTELFDSFERKLSSVIGTDTEGTAPLPSYLLRAAEVVHRAPPESSSCVIC